MYYPRSFLKFILLRFLLVSLPLVYALAELILSLDRLQTQGQQAVQQAAQAGRASRLLFEQSGTLERLVRQHIILDDAALLDDYARVRQEFRRRSASSRCCRCGGRRLAALDSAVRERERGSTTCCARSRAGPRRRSGWPTATRGSSTARRRCSARPTN